MLEKIKNLKIKETLYQYYKNNMERIQEFIWNDTILIKKQEHIVSVFFRFIKSVAIFLAFAIMLSYIIHTLTWNIFFICFLLILTLIISFLYVRLFYKDTFLVVTNTKVLKSVRNGVFSSHVIELPLSRIRQIRANNNGLCAKLCCYWDIEIQGFEESSNMYFKAMTDNKKVMGIISQAIEHIKEPLKN